MKPVNWNDPDLVGKKILRVQGGRRVKITALGQDNFLGIPYFRDSEDMEEEFFSKTKAFTDENDWYYYEEPEEEVTSSFRCTRCHNVMSSDKLMVEGEIVCEYCFRNYGGEEKKPKLLAPALIKNDLGSVVFSAKLYSSLKEAKKGCSHLEPYKVIWPALPNKDGFYEVDDG